MNPVFYIKNRTDFMEVLNQLYAYDYGWFDRHSQDSEEEIFDSEEKKGSVIFPLLLFPGCYGDPFCLCIVNKVKEEDIGGHLTLNDYTFIWSPGDTILFDQANEYTYPILHPYSVQVNSTHNEINII